MLAKKIQLIILVLTGDEVRYQRDCKLDLLLTFRQDVRYAVLVSRRGQLGISPHVTDIAWLG